MFHVRRMHHEDIAFAVGLTNQEKWGITRNDFQRLLQLAPHGCFVAHEGKRKLGVATTTSYGREAAWIGNVVIEKAHRGEHIGAGLVEHAVGYLRKSGVKRIILYCFDENVQFYRNLGFVKDVRFARLKRKAKPSSSKSGGMENPHTPPLDRILPADKKAFGADRSKLIRTLLSEHIGWYVGIEHGSADTSFLFVKQYDDLFELGPWVSLKRRRGESARMLGTALSKVAWKPIEMSCLLSHSSELALLREKGFRIVNRGYRMCFGKRYRLGDDQAQYALGFLDKG